MRRATTPTHIFSLPENVKVADITEALVSYSQCGNTILEKEIEDLALDSENNNFSITLSQTETNLFAPGRALIQVRVKVNDAVLTSQMILLTVKPALNSKEL